jgi:membrane protease YdiL (CAAX protease family)
MLAILRGVLAAAVILALGQVPLGLFLTLNLKYSPSIPWLLPATLGILWLYFRYLGGQGWPASTSEQRRRLLRGQALPAGIWLWSLIAGGNGMTSAMCLAFITVRVTHVSQQSLNSPLDFANLPVLTVCSVLLAIAATAGVVEEAAFRGYLISLIEERYGWLIAFLLSALLFFATHLSHAYASLNFLPFFLSHCAVLTLLVYFTRSIRPSIVIHAASDLIMLPMQYGLVGQRLPISTGPYVIVAILCALAAVPAFRKLAQAVDLCTDHRLASGGD